jgi:hypothetical protein
MYFIHNILLVLVEGLRSIKDRAYLLHIRLEQSSYKLVLWGSVMPNTKSKMALESIIICYWVIRIIYLPSPVTLSVRGCIGKKIRSHHDYSAYCLIIAYKSLDTHPKILYGIRAWFDLLLGWDFYYSTDICPRSSIPFGGVFLFYLFHLY